MMRIVQGGCAWRRRICDLVRVSKSLGCFARHMTNSGCSLRFLDSVTALLLIKFSIKDRTLDLNSCCYSITATQRLIVVTWNLPK
jgi:hypothetical protein